MKKLISILVVLAVVGLVGCAGFQLTDDANSKFRAYIAGKLMAIGVYNIAPQAAPSIEGEWMSMMGRNFGKPEIPPEEMINFFEGVVLKQVPQLKNDKYGFAGDLRYFLEVYGAEYAPDTGVITKLKPIPMVIAVAFQTGYEGGRSVELKK
jgi:hypothetical protein